MPDRNRIRIHDFKLYTEPTEDGFSLGDIPGIGLYPDRSVLLRRGICYLDGSQRPDVIEHYWKEYLRVIGIGASELRFVNGESLFAGILQNPDERARFLREFSGAHRRTLEAFSASPAFDRFVETLGIDSMRLRTPSTRVMRLIDDKLYFRLLADELGLTDAFPNYAYADDPAEVMGLIRVYRNRYPHLVVAKRPDLDSGVGQLLIWPHTKDLEIRAYVNLYATGHRPIIVEAVSYTHLTLPTIYSV